MGGGRFTSDDWSSYSSTKIAGKSRDAIFTSRGMDPLLDPKGVSVREARDSEDNPNSNAIAIFVDVTGSMGMIAETMVRTGLNTLITELYDRKPIESPQIMVGAIGDVVCDDAPLQLSQYESDIRIADQLTKIYLEGRGGGNSSESYTFPWYFAAMHTSIDCFEKRGKKGYLFTAGDEEVPAILKATEIEKFLGYRPETDFTAADLLTLVSRQYEVFHLMVEEGSHMRGSGDSVRKSWSDLLGQRAIPLSDHTKLSEVIVSIIQSVEGEAKDKITASWDNSTALVVSKAINGLTTTDTSGDIVTL
jgi:hypothetical protein